MPSFLVFKIVRGRPGLLPYGALWQLRIWRQVHGTLHLGALTSRCAFLRCTCKGLVHAAAQYTIWKMYRDGVAWRLSMQISSRACLSKLPLPASMNARSNQASHGALQAHHFHRKRHWIGREKRSVACSPIPHMRLYLMIMVIGSCPSVAI